MLITNLGENVGVCKRRAYKSSTTLDNFNTGELSVWLSIYFAGSDHHAYILLRDKPEEEHQVTASDLASVGSAGRDRTQPIHCFECSLQNCYGLQVYT